ncbi:MAG TPA: MBOAT family O-acyltransferase [bacterium]|nr:MBOAT family O-acyltransferase [bacterium]
MLFTSFSFLALLPLAVVLHALLPVRYRWAWLLLASYLFYAAWVPVNAVYLGAVTLLVFGCGWGMGLPDRPRLRRVLLVVGLVAVLGLLVTFKFYDFLAGELERFSVAALGLQPGLTLPRLGLRNPAGLSFYAFSAVSYLVDVYAGRLPTERHAGKLALYVAFFPKIFAGPIERATSFLPQLRTGLRVEPERFVAGLQLIVWGLFKKVVIADNLAPMVDRSFHLAAYISPVELVLGAYFFAFQIYCDFSGYTDIAIGVSRLFGIELMENFRRPYLSRSTAEFWGNRWHISLAHWFRDYLYIPLGGSRAGQVRRYANVMLVFAVSGLWHAGLGYGVGWTFLVWGALNGFYQWVGLATAPLWRRLGGLMPRVQASPVLAVLRVLLTFHLVLVAWVFFRADSVSQALLVLRRIATGLGHMPAMITRYPFTVAHLQAVCLIALLMAVEVLDERRPLWERLAAMPVAVRWAAYYAVLAALLILGRWQAREFIYMQF